MTIWKPVDSDTAKSLIGEGLHTGFRKGTDAPEAMTIWRAINDSDQAWPEALEFMASGLEYMGFALCKREEVPLESARLDAFLAELEDSCGPVDPVLLAEARTLFGAAHTKEDSDGTI